ncbi:hypothetical protein BD413DRAFT_617626 [Trametes elegans]|nr:hypothetical protein BD413DRAFT_617626 [Trametes elegans]
MESLVKAALLLTSALLVVSTLLPPKPRVEGKTQGTYKGQPFEYVVRFLSYLACFAIASPSFTQAAILVGLQRDNPSLGSYLCPRHPHLLQPLTTLTPRFLLGAALVYAGGLLRLWSFKTLGCLFTYEVAIHDDHVLITSGPYAYVRHPSYTGVILLLLGEHLMQFGAPAGYVPYCGIAATPFGVLVTLWRFVPFFVAFSLAHRCGVEDGKLADRFGSPWEDYAARVRYKIFPYIL